MVSLAESTNLSETSTSPKTSPNSNADTARTRELYKYFQPRGLKDVIASKHTRPDTVLTAHAQLCAWRLDCQRALVSLIDRDTQYAVAESTKTLDLDDPTSYEDEDDAIWAGCNTYTSKEGKLCEQTLLAMPTEDGTPSFFEILDLSKDERFNKLPFVQGPPQFRYYIGVPIRTKKGVNIGSLYCIDTRVKPPASMACKMFLTLMAQNVMTHLEMKRDKEEKKRAMNMNLCLAQFVDPENSFQRQSSQTSPVRQPALTAPRNPSPQARPEERPERPMGSPLKGHKRNISSKDGGVYLQSPNIGYARTQDIIEDSSNNDSDAPPHAEVTEDDHADAFRRAADLLRQSLSVDEGGGVVFLDTAAAIRRDQESTQHVSSSEDDRAEESYSRRGSVGDISVKSDATKSVHSAGHSSLRRIRQTAAADILGSSITDPSNPSKPRRLNKSGGDGFTSPDPAILSKLIKRHPRGKLYHIDTEGLGSTSSADESAATHDDDGRQKKRTPQEVEKMILLKHFPAARQIIFLPLWDASNFRWSVCFAYNTSEYRNFSHGTDFLYSIAFCNCLMTEVARLATLVADRQKGDFIGSISHELRSPLHGILASCEFLGDTELTAFQKSLVDTADSCGRTLLDTINNVLDYSKINTFERNVRSAKRQAKKGGNPFGNNQGLSGHQPFMNIYGDVDLAAITEEVVEGVATGQAFMNFSNMDLGDTTTGVRTRLGSGSGAVSMGASSGSQVEVILDIAPRSWTFVTQPGAFRRVVMNLFGNALKYTAKGFIKVKLTAQGPEPPSKRDSHEEVPTFVTLTITDTGKGISPEYLRTKLFTPFAQENHLAPGTGLGLSLVRSIINMLNGDIEIKSVVGQGTKVIVKLPMMKSSPSVSTGSTSTPSSAGSTIERVKDDSIVVLRKKAAGMKVALFIPSQFEDIDKTGLKAQPLIFGTVTKYVTEWFELAQQDWWTPNTKADIVFCDEQDLPQLFEHLHYAGRQPVTPSIIALCTNASRHATTHAFQNPNHIVEFLSKPFGPHKLAKALRLCLEKREVLLTSDAGRLPSVQEDIQQADPTEDMVVAVEGLNLRAPRGSDSQDVKVTVRGQIMANNDSVNAAMALESASSGEEGDIEGDRFPFPSPSPGTKPSSRPTTSSPDSDVTPTPARSSRPGYQRGKTWSGERIPTLKSSKHNRRRSDARKPDSNAVFTPPYTAPNSATASSKSTPPTVPVEPPKPREPRILLVEDNLVNLRLLQVFMQKLSLTAISTATNGLQAVETFASLPDPPDIIFMDISMPILNGFEATRRIRAIEEERRAQMSAMETTPPALIIALTGLASGRDQSEAFTSGVDLYITKPVSFREVGRLLDNWQANGGAGKEDGLPHGPVVGKVSSEE